MSLPIITNPLTILNDGYGRTVGITSDGRLKIDVVDASLQADVNEIDSILSSVLFALDGYDAADPDIPDIKESIQTILKDLDGYALEQELDGLKNTEAEHFVQLSTALVTVLKDLDGYALNSDLQGLVLTVEENKSSQNLTNKFVLQSLDGYASDISVLESSITGLNSTLEENKNAQSEINDTILKDLDGYALQSSLSSLESDVSAIQLDISGLNQTVEENKNQQSQFNQTVLKDLDGYATQSSLDSTNNDLSALDSRLDTNELQLSQVQNGLDGYIPTSQKGFANGVATLDSGGKIPALQIPAVALPQVYVVADATARLALSVQEGDEAIQTDDGYQFIYDGSSWIQRPDRFGDVVGPGSATDFAIVRFDGVTGKALQNSNVTIADNGNIVTPGNIDVANVNVTGNVDGRDISVDGAKLDTIESNAKDDQTITAGTGLTGGGTGDITLNVSFGSSSGTATQGNDSRIPTQNENDALQGTSGSPSNSNRYVTDNDNRLSDSRDPNSHASTHIRGGSDQIDGDQLDIDYSPSNYTPDTNPSQVSSSEHLTAHLAGIDAELANISSGGDELDYFDGVDETGGTTVGNSWTDIPLNTIRRKDSPYTHTSPGSEVTFNEAGLYTVFAKVTTEGVNGSNRTQNEMRVVLDEGSGYNLIPGTRGGMYCREVTEGTGTASAMVTVDVNSGDKIKVQAQRVSGTTDVELLPNGSSLLIIRLKGAKGDKGDTGSGSTISIEEDNSSVGSPFSTINFTGSGVSVSDAGSGQVDVDISGGSASVFGADYQYEESLAETSTTATSFQNKVSLTTPSLTGTYRVGWRASLEADNGDGEIRLLNETDSEAIDLGQATSGGGPVSVEFFHFSGFQNITFTGTAKTFRIQYRQVSAGSVNIRDAKIEFWRVS